MLPERIEKLLNDIRLVDEDRHALVQSLRELILSVDRSISEEVKYGGLLYSAGSPFCGIFSYAQHVSIEFSNGAALPDPHHVLEGDGKLRRHIKVRTAGEITSKHVREYVAKAFAATSKQKSSRPHEKKRT